MDGPDIYYDDYLLPPLSSSVCLPGVFCRNQFREINNNIGGGGGGGGDIGGISYGGTAAQAAVFVRTKKLSKTIGKNMRIEHG